MKGKHEEASDTEQPETGAASGADKSPKKRAKTAKSGLAELKRQMKAAVKAEDFIAAQKIKEQIAALGGDSPGTKRASSPPKGAQSPAKKAKTQAAKPVVEELATDPFFDNASQELLAPQCLTIREREALRAVQTDSTAFLVEKLVGRVPLFKQRDIVSRQTSLHLAIERGNGEAINILAKEISNPTGRHQERQAAMTAQGTGTMSVLTLGFATGKIGVARGGREMNNALVDPNEGPEPMQDVVARSNLKPEHLLLLVSQNVLSCHAASLRQSRRRKRARIHAPASGGGMQCSLEQILEPALLAGRLPTVRTILEKMSCHGVSPVHKAAVADAGDLPEKLQSRSVTTMLRFGSQLTAVHLAAGNPDASKLSAMLKLEPSAVSQTLKSGLQPVHVAAGCSGSGPLQLLVSEWGVSRSTLGPNKRTPLHFAARAGRVANISVLMGGGGAGVGGTHLFTKEIKVVLHRQTASSIKAVSKDGVRVLSMMLVDVLRRVASNAKRLADNSEEMLGSEALHEATQLVLSGSLVPRIAETAQKIAAGKLTLPRTESRLASALAEMGEDALQQMFNSIDTNDDGKLDRSEIAAVFAKGSSSLGEDELGAVLKEMDLDGNGDVSFDEFSSWMDAGSSHAVALRRQLVVQSGTMGEAEVAEAERDLEEAFLQDVDKLAFDVRELLELLEFSGVRGTLERQGSYASAILECVCTKVLEVCSNAARSQKKTTISPEIIINSVKTNEDLRGLYQMDSVVMNTLLLPVKDKNQYTALHDAAEAGHAECVEALLACNADANLAGPDRKTSLALAAERGHASTVRALLAARAKLEQGDKRKRTPLLLAVRAGRTVEASILLHSSANPDAADDSGNSVVHYAAAFGWVDCIDMLHKAGANLSPVNAMKLAPITAALQKGHKRTFRRLLELGIDVNFRDADGSTLMLSSLSAANRLILDEVKFMLSKRADPSLASSHGTTPLHALASARQNNNSTSNYAAHPFEVERLQRLRGWEPRPKPPPKTEESDDDGDNDEAEKKKAKKEKPQEALLAEVWKRGFHQLSVAEREAVFRLGWKQKSWQEGHNPTKSWSELTEQQRQAAVLLGLGEATWAVIRVRCIANIKSPDGLVPVKHGVALYANDDGMVTVQIGDKVDMVHVSKILLPEEDLPAVCEAAPHVTKAIAQQLVEAGAQPDARDAQGFTPLLLALRSGFTDLALYLLSLRADPNATATLPAPAGAQASASKKPPEVQTSLLLAAKAPTACLAGGLNSMYSVVEALLRAGAKATEKSSATARSPILGFLQKNDIPCARLLLDAGADCHADSEGENVLHKTFKLSFDHPCKMDAVEFSKKVLSSGDLGVELMREFSGNSPHVTPLYSMIKAFSEANPRCLPEGGAKKRAELLLEMLNAIPASVDFSSWLKQTTAQDGKLQPSMLQGPLGILCSNEFFGTCQSLGLQLVKALCERGVNPNSTVQSPAALHSLAQRLNGDLTGSCLVEVLLPLTDLNAKTPDGQTLLTYTLECAKSGRGGLKETVKKLLEARADPNVMKEDSSGSRLAPLHFAAILRDESFVEALLNARADAQKLDHTGRSPLHVAVACAPTGADANFDIEDMLLLANADVGTQDKWGRSPLHYAFMKHSNGSLSFDEPWVRPEQVRVGSDSKVVESWTPKAWQLIQERIDPIETVSSLCAVKGVTVNTIDNFGMSPLQLACVRGSSIAALKLISARANLELTFKHNTPLGLAMQKYPEMAVLLMQRNASTTVQCTMLGHPGRRSNSSDTASIGEPESIFSLAIRQVAQSQAQTPSRLQNDSSGSATSAFLGAAITALDCGFPCSQALSDTIASQQFIMLLTLIPKVGDEVLRKQRFGGGANLLHRLASARGVSQQPAYLRAVEKVAQRKVPLSVDDEGQTPLHLAAGSSYPQLVELLLEYAKQLETSGGESSLRSLVRTTDRQGVTALGKAFASSVSSSQEVLRIAAQLVANGAEVKQAIVVPDEHETVLMYCIRNEWSPLATKEELCWPQVLFSTEQPDVTLVDTSKRSCLMHAARAKRYSLLYLKHIAAWAVKAGVAPQVLLGKDKDGLTSLLHAIDAGHTGFVAGVLKFAKDTSDAVLAQVLATQASDGTHALLRAVDAPDSVPIMCELFKAMDAATVVKTFGTTDQDGRTALMRAVLRNSMPLVQILLACRPLVPAPTETTCPSGLMAGDRAWVRTYLTGASSGAPEFALEWLLKEEQRDEHHDNIASAQGKLLYKFELVLPPGTGPGIVFKINWGELAAGPGVAGLAEGFANQTSTRVPCVNLSKQDSLGRSAVHCCVKPLPFGSFENDVMLEALIKAGVPAGLRDAHGQTAADLASEQRSGKLAKCLQTLGVTVPQAQSSSTQSAAGSWPEPVNLNTDAEAALSEALLESKSSPAHSSIKKTTEPPVEKHFKPPSKGSQVVVARGTDGEPLDLVMTKVDVSKGPYGQNVYYRMQVLHESNQDNYFLFTRWGRIGDVGQFQTTPFESLEKAALEFAKIFKSKAGNEWAERSQFEKKPLKYQLHTIKYGDVAPADALHIQKWKQLPAASTPLPLRRLLNVAASPDLLASALQKVNLDRPLGLLEKKPLDDAKIELEKIRELMRKKSEEERKSEPSGTKLQELAEQVATASNRIYELVPTRNFQRTNVAPIDSLRQVQQWLDRLAQADELACAARLLLGAQRRIKEMNPTDYVYRALGMRLEPLSHESPELQMIERYINRSAPQQCLLYSGPSALPLPEKPKATTPEAIARAAEEALPLWQALRSGPCYTDAKCQEPADFVTIVGCCYREYKRDGDAICVRKKREDATTTELWVKAEASDGAVLLVRLNEREVASKIAAIYRADFKDEAPLKGADESSNLLFHGSGMANALAILKQGLLIKPPGATHQGSAFGNGIYFANGYSKSRSYCQLSNGVGFMLLCEVAVGRSLPSDGNFQRTVQKARLTRARALLGLKADVKPEQHAGLREALRELEEQSGPEVQDVSGTGFDSLHFQSGSAPDPSGNVVHPDGYMVPAGEIVSRSGGSTGGFPGDEIIVYERERVRLRYVIELRDVQTGDATFRKLPKQNADSMDVDTAEGTDGDGGFAADSAQDAAGDASDDDRSSDHDDDGSGSGSDDS